MGLFQRANSDKWYARFKNANGQWVNRSTGTSNKQLAKEILTKWEYDATQVSKTGRKELPSLPCYEFMEKYLQHREKGKNSETVKLDRLALEEFIKNVGPTTLIKHISSQDIEQYLETLHSRDLSPYTLRQRLTHLKRALNWAIESDLLYLNPASKVSPPPIPQQSILEIPRKDIRLLLDNSQGTWIGDYIAAAAYGGFRSSEITHIKEDDIHWDDNYVSVVGKFDKRRSVPLFPSLKTLFTRILEYTPTSDPRITAWNNGKNDPFLFYQVNDNSLVSQAFKGIVRSIWSKDKYEVTSSEIKRTTGEMISQDELFIPTEEEKKRLGRSIKKVAVEHHDEKDRYKFHDLRHTFATNYLRNGGSIEKLRKILGHKQISTTLKYEHLVINDLQEDEDPVTY
ncbi:MAG: tyrosine-type recombinase/integrase [Candidatus Marinimicrobia bacterium]|nr:tyrosine-type recombinase/integrase [Candidatus Neomarinimicrobiota bacterium]MCF7880208.1 tyrosine-type recombinase/integrase [Candidatus Neomarinimicrobiota bacterium]